MTTLLEVDNISKNFAGVRALSSVSLTVAPGEIRCLAGENGSGKSTLIKIIAGALAPDEGSIYLNGRRYASLQPMDAIREGVQIIYQDFSLFPNLSTAENIALNYELANGTKFINPRRIRRLAKEVLAKIGVSIPLDAKVETLPVADKQLIAISRALLYEAKLLIMDEPTTALTEKEVRVLLAIIRKLQADGVAVLFVSHKFNEVFEVSEKITVLRNGEVVEDGDAKSFTFQKLAFSMTGRSFGQTHRHEPKEDARDILRVEGLSKRGAFADISFSLREGEILGIAGLLGSGRTGLAMALFGLTPYDSGKVYIAGEPVTIASPQDAIAQGIGYVPEDRLTEGLFLQQSIGKNIVVSTIDGFVGGSSLLGHARMRREMRRWVADLKIVTPSPDLPVQSLSGGNQQRVVLARWLATSPKLLILNGPTVGVDIGSKADIHELIAHLAAEGMAVLIISDDIPELLGSCGRILIMKEGRVVESLAANDTDENALALKLAS